MIMLCTRRIRSSVGSLFPLFNTRPSQGQIIPIIVGYQAQWGVVPLYKHLTSITVNDQGKEINPSSAKSASASVTVDASFSDSTSFNPELQLSLEEYKNIPGSQTSDEKMVIQFTCNVCNTSSMKKFSKHSYESGVVLVRCPSCQNLHVIADRLGYFGEKDWDIEKHVQEQQNKEKTPCTS